MLLASDTCLNRFALESLDSHLITFTAIYITVKRRSLSLRKKDSLSQQFLVVDDAFFRKNNHRFEAFARQVVT